MIVWLAFCLCLLGFALLARAMERHAEALTGIWPRVPALAVRLGAGLLLLGGLVLCVRQWGLSVGVAGGLGLATFAALILALLFTYAEDRVWRNLAWGLAAGTGAVLLAPL